jgi:phospholipid/cholesterol/gamma-HCH transport system substrate-binding protein
MNAAKSNFLFRGYYKRKEKEAEKLKNETVKSPAEQKTTEKK